ncbi:MAG: leucine-rich repeat domain-containing protein [Eubacterium sp.]|nr:leucine-rich repeat domain-containing protein [Eubacterium sp.]
MASTTRRIRNAKRIIIIDIIFFLMIVFMVSFVKFRKHEALTYKENYKSLDLNGTWYMVDVDDVFVVEMDDGDYTKRDIDGNLVNNGTYKIGEHTINLDGSDYPIDYTDDYLEAEYLADTKDLEGYSLSKHFEVKIHGNSIYYFSVKEAAEDQVDFNMTTNEYYQRNGLFNNDKFAIDGDDTLVAYTGDAESVRVPSEATDIAANTFSTDYNRAKKVKKVIIPSSVKTIESYAFAFSNVEEVSISEGITQIHDNIFANSKVKDVYLPDSIDYLGDNIFGNSKGVKVHCTKDSATYKFLNEHNQKKNFEIITD